MEILLVLGLCIVIIVILYKDLDKEWKANSSQSNNQSENQSDNRLNLDTQNVEVQDNTISDDTDDRAKVDIESSDI